LQIGKVLARGLEPQLRIRSLGDYLYLVEGQSPGQLNPIDTIRKALDGI
jgi:hypothetical protein